MSHRACICGLSYVRGLPKDEAKHRKIHSEYFIGPSIPSISKAPILDDIDGLAVHVVDERTPFEVRRKIAHVAMVGQRSMSGYPAGYDGTVNEEHQRLYVLVEMQRTIGFVLSATDTRFWKLAWTLDDNVQLLDRNPSLHPGSKIGRVWVAAKYRRKGLAKKLVFIASKNLGVVPSEFGWELPFTIAGTALVRSLAPSTFYGCGDETQLPSSHQRVLPND